MPWLTDGQTEGQTEGHQTIPGDNTSAKLKLKGELIQKATIVQNPVMLAAGYSMKTYTMSSTPRPDLMQYVNFVGGCY